MVSIKEISSPLKLGEGPHWDVEQQCLYFVGIMDKTIHKYVPASGKLTTTKLDGMPGFIVPVKNTKDQFVVGLELNFALIRWNGEENSKVEVIKILAKVDQDFLNLNRINDGKVDPRGRIYAGTMGKDDPPGNFQLNKGSLFKLDGSKVSKIADKISISNGLAWNVAEKAFYYIDSLEYKVRRYDYDINTGDISNPKTVVDFKKNNWLGIPDGMTIDTEGKLWIACFGGSRVIRIDPQNGNLISAVDMPAPQTTSVAFGGANLDVLYVTTANVNKEHKSPAGATFAVTGLGVKGLPADAYIL